MWIWIGLAVLFLLQCQQIVCGNTFNNMLGAFRFQRVYDAIFFFWTCEEDEIE